MKEDGVSNEPATFACHMNTYVLPSAHVKLSEIDGQTRFFGFVAVPVRGLLSTPEAHYGLDRVCNMNV